MAEFTCFGSLLVVLFCFALFVEKTTCGRGFYGFSFKDIQGNVHKLEEYTGMVSLVVNVATECGYTDEHYRQLSALYNELAMEKKEPFVVFGFPCNQFGQQEPHDNEEIEKFALETYGVNFPLFSKLDVTGTKAHSAFNFLAESSGKTPSWNFWKYLIDGDGQVIDAWGPRTSVEAIKPDIMKAIEKVKLKHNEL